MRRLHALAAAGVATTPGAGHTKGRKWSDYSTDNLRRRPEPGTQTSEDRALSKTVPSRLRKEYQPAGAGVEG